jgi:hypothetical protein
VNAPFSKRRRTIRQFGDKLGFIYFGTVDQHTDDHRAVRGFSVSPTHKDSSYMVGNYEDFDVIFVDRLDKGARWFICDIDLKEDVAPHFFLVPTHQKDTHYKKIFTALHQLEPMPAGAHTPEFHNRYQIYCSPTHMSEMEDILTSEITRTIAAHFWPLALEVWDGSLFIYSAEKNLTGHHIETMIKNGTWLAQVLTVPKSLD